MFGDEMFHKCTLLKKKAQSILQKKMSCCVSNKPTGNLFVAWVKFSMYFQCGPDSLCDDFFFAKTQHKFYSAKGHKAVHSSPIIPLR